MKNIWKCKATLAFFRTCNATKNLFTLFAETLSTYFIYNTANRKGLIFSHNTVAYSFPCACLSKPTMVCWLWLAARSPLSCSLIPPPQQGKGRKEDIKALGSRERQGDILLITIVGKTDSTWEKLIWLIPK